MFNNLLKALHAKDDPAHYKPKRLNLSEELEKLPMLSDTVDLFPETMPPPEGIANGLTPTFRFSSSATAGEATNRRTTWESPSIAFSSPPAASMAPNRPSTSSSLTSMFVFPSYSTGAIATDRPSTSSSPSPISLFASSTATLPSDRSSTTFGSHMTPKLASKRLSGSVPAHRHHHHNFQKEGFRTTSIRPTKSVTKHTETPRPVAH
ncbi:hypothetical protein KP509_39G027300 [Ceratopteris richardii]|nr:hypothetical protein KP509_39G027300 [Ceratopteris richardii]